MVLYIIGPGNSESNKEVPKTAVEINTTLTHCSAHPPFCPQHLFSNTFAFFSVVAPVFVNAPPYNVQVIQPYLFPPEHLLRTKHCIALCSSHDYAFINYSYKKLVTLGLIIVKKKERKKNLFHHSHATPIHEKIFMFI